MHIVIGEIKMILACIYKICDHYVSNMLNTLRDIYTYCNRYT
jgi:hypothetical protein